MTVHLQVTLNTAAAGAGAQLGGNQQPGAAAALPPAAAAAAPRIRTLLDYVAWLSALSSSGGGSRKQWPLSEELAGVEQAAARMQVRNSSGFYPCYH